MKILGLIMMGIITVPLILTLVAAVAWTVYESIKEGDWEIPISIFAITFFCTGLFLFLTN